MVRQTNVRVRVADVEKQKHGSIQNGERSRLGCRSTRPRVEHERGCANESASNIIAQANDEGVVGCARGGRAPRFLILHFTFFIFQASHRRQ
jgi:hypothetical protein